MLPGCRSIDACDQPHVDRAESSTNPRGRYQSHEYNQVLARSVLTLAEQSLQVICYPHNTQLRTEYLNLTTPKQDTGELHLGRCAQNDLEAGRYAFFQDDWLGLETADEGRLVRDRRENPRIPRS